MTWAGYAPDSEEVVLTNPDPLPPAEEMIGVIGTPEEEAGERGEEIQLAHGGCSDCDYTGTGHGHGHGHGDGHGHDGHGHDGHGHDGHRHDGHGHDGHGNSDIIIIDTTPVVIGDVCRDFLGFCYTDPTPVGTPCYCINNWGYKWLQGRVSLY